MNHWVVGGLIAGYAAAFAANVGHFAWSYDAGWLQILTSAVYVVMWLCFVMRYRCSRAGMTAAAIMGGITAAGGVLGLLARTLGSAALTIPALLLAGISVTPLYGLLSLLKDYDSFYLAAAVWGMVCLGIGLWLRQRQTAKKQDGK